MKNLAGNKTVNPVQTNPETKIAICNYTANKTGFVAKRKALFRALFGRLPKQVQEAYAIEYYLNLLP